MATATAVFAVANVGISLAAGHKERGAERDRVDAAKGERAERKRIADVRAVRERRNVIREGRIARAQSVAAGVQSGAGAGSSGVAGGVGSVGSQLNANLSFLDTVKTAEANISIFQQQGADARSSGQAAGQIRQLGNTIFGSGGLAERLNT